MLFDIHKYFMPSGEPTARAKAWWRQWTGAGVAVAWIFMWWSLGVLGDVPIIGAGFAKAGDVKSIEIQLLQQSLFENKIRHCNAKNEAGAQLIQSVITQQLILFEQKTGNKYPLPTCDELLGLE